MALRVLLADESSTIKKVFQLALQDFAVEVRPVNVGVDVVAVAQSFMPDIIFVDILLQKKNGYEVAAELKQTADLKSIPVVLMWSGFMELDDDKFQASMANSKLEKPFDVGALRKLVTDLVPKTQTQRISKFLNFPDTPAEAEAEPAELQSNEPEAPEEEFTQMPIAKMRSPGADKFRVDLKPEELEPEHIPVDYTLPDEPDEVEEFAVRGQKKPSMPPPVRLDAQDEDDLVLDTDDLVEETTPTPTATPVTAAPLPALSETELERIIRSQSAEVIESVVWKVIPEIATQIIERELSKLLKERELNY